jgi:ribosomal protein S18 acetylase RimI-like enzyme
MARFCVSPASPDDLTAACWLLFGDRHAARCRDLLAAGEVDPAGLFVATDDRGTVRGAVLVQVLPGALGLAWPPRVGPEPDRAGVEDGLVSAGCNWLRGRGVKVSQAFAAADERPAMVPLERHGFGWVTRVAHLRREVDPRRDVIRSLPDDARLEFHVHRAAHPVPEFRPTLLATATGSLDCPELSGARSDVEQVSGYREDGYLAYHRGEPVGVLLLDPLTQPGVTDLSYLGLIPSARGRGFGDELMRMAIGSAEFYASHVVEVSVDVRNEPALRLYRRHGFVEHDRQDVYLAIWPVPANGRA